MKIVGIGTDIVLKSRIKAVLEKFGERFIQRILSQDEQSSYYRSSQSAAFLAKRFAAKEAVAKAFGTGIGKQLRFNEISVTNLPSGKPHIILLGRATSLMENCEIHISLADEKEHALAFVVITAT